MFASRARSIARAFTRARALIALACVARVALARADETAQDVDAHATWLRRELPRYRARAASCVACQRVLAHFDEHLVLALQDITNAERRKATSATGGRRFDAARYGAYESVIEEAVPRACATTSVALNRTLRVACERMIERSEDEVVKLYYEVGKAMERGEKEADLGEALCGANGAMGGACEDAETAAWTVSELEALETAAMKVSREDLNPWDTAPGHEGEFLSEPEYAAPKKGEVARIVASDFYKRIILERDIDAVVYFSYPTKAKEFHEAYEQTHALLAEVLEDAKDLIIAQIDVEKNDVPPPYADMATTPCVLLYRAKKKENPRWVPLRTEAGEYITGESAPTLADVLTMVSKNAKTKKTKREADKALVEASAEELHSNRAKDDEL